MCSYKVVKVKFEVWGLQTKVEQFGQKVGDILCFNFEFCCSVFLGGGGFAFEFIFKKIFFFLNRFICYCTRWVGSELSLYIWVFSVTNKNKFIFLSSKTEMDVPRTAPAKQKCLFSRELLVSLILTGCPLHLDLCYN